jgi:hypothetical protein
MTWTQQKQFVEMLSARASEKRRQARHARGNLKLWLASSLGSLDTLAWTFAVGAWWAAGRSSTPQTVARRRSMIAAINSFWLAWELVHRRVKLAQPKADYPAEGKR